MLWGPVTSRATRPPCVLEIDGTVVLTSRHGTPEAECGLFDPGDIELEAERPGTNRERGYRTTVGAARERLTVAGITPALAAEAVDLVRPALARTYARGAAARCIVDRLEAAELFEARGFDAASSRYEGTWLDVAALARDLGPSNAGAVLQALHLAARLSELPTEAPVVLTTQDPERRAGERTLRRPDLTTARALVEALRELRPTRVRDATDAGPSRAEVVAWLRERARVDPSQQRRFAAMETALSTRAAPARGPLAETALWNLETRLTRGELDGVAEQLDELERRRGRAPGTTYLRARLSLLTRVEEPGAVAERAATLATSMSGFHEVELLAAQAWLAAGDTRRARAFARDLQENVSADDILRMQAMAVLVASGPGSSATMAAVVPGAPAVVPGATAAGGGAPRVSDPIQAAAIPRPPRAPSATELEPTGRGASLPSRVSSVVTMRSLPAGTAFPPFRLEARPAGTLPSMPAVSTGGATPSSAIEANRLETLALPAGLEAAAPAGDELPRSPTAGRTACTFLARELGRELRLRHGVELQDDVDGLEIAQRYLREAFVDGRVKSPADEREILRHGAFLSELVARRLGGEWVDVQGHDAGTWAMLVPVRSRPGEVLRIWPFGRVLRFVVMGHKERDLVSYYLELEARAR